MSDWPPTNTVRFLVPTWIETLPSQPDDRMRLTELGIATFSEQGINDSPRSFEIQIVNPDSAKQMLHRDNGRTIAGRALQRQDFVIAYAGVHLTASEQVAPLGGGF